MPERIPRNISPAANAGPPLGRARPPRLGELLCERGLLSAEQLEAALHHQKTVAPATQLGKILVDLNLVKAAQIVETLANSIGTPYTFLTPEMVRREAVDALPGDYLEKNNLLPLSFAEGWLTIAVEQFTDVVLIEEMRRLAGCHVQVIAAEPENIRQTRKTVLQSANRLTVKSGLDATHGLDEILEQIGVDDMKVVEHERSEDDADLIADAADSPVVKLVNYVVQKAVETQASDIHVEPGEGSFRVRYRVDGELLEALRPAGRLLPAVVSRIKIMAGMDISERRLPQDGGMTVTLANRRIDLRVATMATKFGEKVVMRIVDHDSSVRSLDSLGFEPDVLARFRTVVQESNGIVLVTGPTGSGKSTTLYAALGEIVSDKRNISTIEDPVERHLLGANQFQVQPRAGFTFASALRSLLRQDPDIIMVGEIRDAETAKLAMEAALTGHLVLSTLHTNDAPTAIPRLINMGVESYLVAASLRGVLAQRLVRRICPQCRKSVNLNRSEKETLAQLCQGHCPMETAFLGVGCSRCRETGFDGRVGVFELLLLREDVLSAIVRDPTMSNLRELTRSQGTLLSDGLIKVRRGLISVPGLLEIVSRADELINQTLVPIKAAA